MQDDFRLTNDLTLDAGLRYDDQTLTDATANFAPRVGFGWHPNGDARTAVRGGYGMYYTQIRSNVVAAALTGGLNGLTTYTAVPGQLGFPTCLTCVPLLVRSGDAASVRAAGARHHDPARAARVLRSAVREAWASTSTRCRTIPTSS